MAKITFIIGGAKSGKSSFALLLAKKHKGKVAFIATAQALDKEMEHRIGLHKKSRPAHWQTFEEPLDITKIIKDIGSGFKCIILDCITLLVSNLLLAGYNQKAIEKEISQLLAALKKKECDILLISNEVGLGIVPANTLGRDFRDIAGKINQIIAGEATEVIFMVSGLPWRIK